MTFNATPSTSGIFNKDFYPTPRHVVAKMLAHVDYPNIDSLQILEPSAGKGDILDAISNRSSYGRSRTDNLYAIEIEPELTAILRDKEYRVIGSDFLKYFGHHHFDLVLMNPPFSDGVDHILKAWEVVADGGQVVCILNAESIRNPHTGKHKLLANLIDQHGKVEFIGAPFTTAERRTSVECVIVVLNKPASATAAEFAAAGMRFDSKVNEEQFSASPLASANIIESLVNSYNCAAKIMTERHKLEQAYRFYLGGITDYEDNKATKRTLNERQNELKVIFWRYVFDKTQIGKRATSKFRQGFEKFIAETNQLAFSVENIMTILEMFFTNQESMVLQCVSDVFDQVTAYHEKNVVHTEGWKTNKSWKVGPKIILPYGCSHEKDWGFTMHGYWMTSSRDFYNDLDRACCFLAGKKLEEILTVEDALIKRINADRHNANIGSFDSTFFTITIFKKGTVHLVWKDRELLNTFNQAAAKHKKWIGQGF